jgi:hypothetical protein
LENKSSSANMSGIVKLSGGLEGSIFALESISGTTSSAVVTSGVSALTFSSLFGNSLGFLTKMIQIIEFTALMQLFNVEFDRNLSRLLSAIANLTNLQVLSFPTEKHLQRQVENTPAGLWKGKLSEAEIAPWMLQEIGYLGILLLAIYLIQIPLFILKRASKFNKTVQVIRIQLFLAFIVDYIGLTLRTLTHASVRPANSPLKIVSYLLAIFFITCFTGEIIIGFYYANKLYDKEDK